VIETIQRGNLRVNVDVFEGPLDLLLYLLKKDEIDIYDIPIAHITTEYLAYLELMKELNLDIAGEFLVMAAELAFIKSRMLLPRPPSEGDVVEEDPRAELVRRLIEYQRYKEASTQLEEREILDVDVFRHPHEEVREAVPLAEERVEVTLFELVSALKGVLSRLPEAKVHEVERETHSMKARIFDLIDILRTRERVEFSELFTDVRTRSLVIVTFLSVLELLKLKMVKVQQAEIHGAIHIYATGDFSDLNEAAIEEYDSTAPEGEDA
jgi:segregation and condensation protein A